MASPSVSLKGSSRQGKAGISWEMMFLGVDTIMTLHRSLRRNRKVTYRIRLGVE